MNVRIGSLCFIEGALFWVGALPWSNIEILNMVPSRITRHLGQVLRGCDQFHLAKIKTKNESSWGGRSRKFDF